MKAALQNHEYPGRVILFGRTPNGENNVIAYAITGRSASSRARCLKQEEDGMIFTDATDKARLKKGNPRLLLYSCVRRLHDIFLVSNGMQTDLLFDTALQLRQQGLSLEPSNILMRAFSQPHWVEGNEKNEFIDIASYEPDAPNYTPRISGIMLRDRFGMMVIKRQHGQEARSLFEYPLHAGVGHFISTYAGKNVPSQEALPSFVGEPISVTIAQNDAESIAHEFFEGIGPKKLASGVPHSGEDYRVGVAVVLQNRSTHTLSTTIINRTERSLLQ